MYANGEEDAHDGRNHDEDVADVIVSMTSSMSILATQVFEMFQEYHAMYQVRFNYSIMPLMSRINEISLLFLEYYYYYY